MGLIPEISERMSIRKFKSRKIDKEKLNSILEAGRRAPSAKNRQPWRFVVIQDKELRKKIEKAAFGQEHVGQAPDIIAVCSTNIGYRMPNGQLSYPVDISFAASFMMFQAQHEGLGSCVVTTFDEAKVKELITVPYSMRIVLLLLIGYPDEVPFPPDRKKIRSITSYNHW